MSKAFVVVNQDENKKEKKGLFSSLRSGKEITFSVEPDVELIEPKKKRRRRKLDDDSSGKKSSDDKKYVADIVAADTPIIDSYGEVTDMIRTSINQISQIQELLEHTSFRNSIRHNSNGPKRNSGQ